MEKMFFNKKNKNLVKYFAEHKFNFNYNLELEEWKRIHLLSCSKKEVWYTRKPYCNTKIYHKNWVDYVYNKYEKYSKKQLKEFKNLLKYIKATETGRVDFFKEYILLLLPILINIYIDDFFLDILSSNDLVISKVIVVIILIISLSLFIIKVFNYYVTEPLKMFFIEEYIKVIDKIIKTK